MNKSTDEVLGLTAQIVSAHVGHDSLRRKFTAWIDPGGIQGAAEYRPATSSGGKAGAGCAGKQSIRQIASFVWRTARVSRC